jgi:hypothetical protein
MSSASVSAIVIRPLLAGHDPLPAVWVISEMAATLADAVLEAQDVATRLADKEIQDLTSSETEFLEPRDDACAA